MPTDRNSKPTCVVALDLDHSDPDAIQFVPVAIPENLSQSKLLKADLEARDIPVLLDVREAEMDEETLGGIPVLVPEGIFEQASQIIGDLELNAADEEEDDFEEDEDEDEDEEEEEVEEEEFEDLDDEDDEDEDLDEDDE